MHLILLRWTYNLTSSKKGTSSNSERYKSVLAAFMSFLYERLPGNAYQPDHVFTLAGLTAVIPSDVCWYLRLKAYGAEFPSPDMNPNCS